MGRSSECGDADNDVQRRSLTRHNNLHKTAHVKCQYAYHTEFPVKSTFLQRNILHLITRSTSPAHTADVVPHPYPRQLAFCSTYGGGVVGGVEISLRIQEVTCPNLNPQVVHSANSNNNNNNNNNNNYNYYYYDHHHHLLYARCLYLYS